MHTNVFVIVDPYLKLPLCECCSNVSVIVDPHLKQLPPNFPIFTSYPSCLSFFLLIKLHKLTETHKPSEFNIILPSAACGVGLQIPIRQVACGVELHVSNTNKLLLH